MKMEEVFKHTFKAMRKQLDEQRAEGRRLWQQRLGTASEFCRAVVSNGYLSEEQMQRAAQRYRLGASRDGGVIFWQIDECDLLRDGKIMHYRPDCHRDHDRKPTWASYLLRKSGRLPKDWNNDHCLFGLHLLMEDVRWKMADVKVAVVEAEKTAVIMSEVKPNYMARHGWQDGTERGETASAGRPSRHPLPRHRRGRTDLPRLVRRGRGCQRRVRTSRQREQHPGAARYPTPESRQDRPRGPVLPPAASMMFMPRKYGTWTTEV